MNSDVEFHCRMMILQLIERVCHAQNFYDQHEKNDTVLSRCELGMPVRSFRSLVSASFAHTSETGVGTGTGTGAQASSSPSPSPSPSPSANYAISTNTNTTSIATTTTTTTTCTSYLSLLAHHEWSQDQHYLSYMMNENEDEDEKQETHAKRITVYQPFVYQQHAEGPCGYYAFHNALHMLQLLCCDESDLSPLTSRICDGIAFWYHFHRARRVLFDYAHRMEQTTGESKYPWATHVVMENVLERPHLLYLLQHYPHVVKPHLTRIAKRRHHDINHLPVTMLSEMTVEALPTLEPILARFRSPDVVNYCHVYIDGAINHWNMIALNKYNNHQLEMIICDSRNDTNHPLVNLNIVNVMLQAQIHPKLRNDYERSIFISSRRMTSHYIDTLSLCASCDDVMASPSVGSCDGMSCMEHYLMVQISDLLFSYYKHAYVVCSECDMDSSMDISLRLLFQRQHIPPRDDMMRPQYVTETSLITWLKHYYPPGLIRSRDICRIKQIGVSYVPTRSGQLLLRWLNEIRENHMIRTCTHPTIISFAQVIQYFYRLIHAHARFRVTSTPTQAQAQTQTHPQTKAQAQHKQKRPRPRVSETHSDTNNTATATPLAALTTAKSARRSRIASFVDGIAKRLRSSSRSSTSTAQ